LRRQDGDLQDELVRMRQGAQRAHELQFIIDSERQTYTRLKGDYDLLKSEIESLRAAPVPSAGAPSAGAAAAAVPGVASMSSSSSTDNLLQQLQDRLENSEIAQKEQIKQIETTHRQHIDTLETQHYRRIDELKATHRLDCEKLELCVNENQMKFRRLDHELKEKTADLESIEVKYLELKGKYKDVVEQQQRLENELLEMKHRMKLEMNEKREHDQEEILKLTEEVQQITREKIKIHEEKVLLDRKLQEMDREFSRKEEEMGREFSRKEEEMRREFSRKEEEMRREFSRKEKEIQESVDKLRLSEREINLDDDEKKDYQLKQLQQEILNFQMKEEQLYLEIERKLKEEKRGQEMKDRKISELEEELEIVKKGDERIRSKGQESVGLVGSYHHNSCHLTPSPLSPLPFILQLQMKLSNLEVSYEELAQEKEEKMNEILQVTSSSRVDRHTVSSVMVMCVVILIYLFFVASK
jgi:hypothetical protein